MPHDNITCATYFGCVHSSIGLPVEDVYSIYGVTMHMHDGICHATEPLLYSSVYGQYNNCLIVMIAETAYQYKHTIFLNILQGMIILK